MKKKKNIYIYSKYLTILKKLVVSLLILLLLLALGVLIAVFSLKFSYMSLKCFSKFLVLV